MTRGSVHLTETACLFAVDTHDRGMSQAPTTEKRVNFKSVFALFLEKELEKRGKTQQWLATEIEGAKSTVSNWASGRKQPDGDKLDAVLRALDITDIEQGLRTLADYAKRVKRGENAVAVEREALRLAKRVGAKGAWVTKRGRVERSSASSAAEPEPPRRGGRSG